MFEFLKRLKIRNRAALGQTLPERGQDGIPHHDNDAFDAILATIVTQELLSTELSSDLESGADTSSTDTGSEDTGSGFDSGGGESGGGGADGDW